MRGQITHAHSGPHQAKIGAELAEYLESLPLYIHSHHGRDATTMATFFTTVAAVSDDLIHTHSDARRLAHNEWADPCIPPFSRPVRPNQYTQDYNCWQEPDSARIHRNAFLLIDGSRTFPELARLLGRSETETRQILQDLEHIGIIQQ